VSEPGLDAVLWDFGGVFTDSPFHAIDAYAQEVGATPVELTNLVLGYHLPDGDHPWHRVERGEMSLTATFDAITSAVHEAGFTDFTSLGFFSAISLEQDQEQRKAMYDVVRRLGDAGIANSLVTNNIVEMGERWRPLVPPNVFDDIVDSSAVGIRKPDPAIYRLALERLGGPDPSRVAFLDDHEANVNAASDLGINGILVGPDRLEAGVRVLQVAGLT
jgi:putative hydrolase of the HAD superfamily